MRNTPDSSSIWTCIGLVSCIKLVLAVAIDQLAERERKREREALGVPVATTSPTPLRCLLREMLKIKLKYK